MAGKQQGKGNDNQWRGVGCGLFILFVLILQAVNGVRGCMGLGPVGEDTSSPPAVTAPPSATVESRPAPKPVQQAVVVDIYSLLGKSRSQVRQALRKYKVIDRTKITSDLEEQYVGGEFVTYSLGKGVEAMFRFNKSGIAKGVLIQNVHIYKQGLEDAEKVIARFGVSGLRNEPEKFPAARNWMDFRDFKVRKVSAIAQPLVADNGGHPYENTPQYVSDLAFELDE